MKSRRLRFQIQGANGPRILAPCSFPPPPGKTTMPWHRFVRTLRVFYGNCYLKRERMLKVNPSSSSRVCVHAYGPHHSRIESWGRAVHHHIRVVLIEVQRVQAGWRGRQPDQVAAMCWVSQNICASSHGRAFTSSFPVEFRFHLSSLETSTSTLMQ